MTCDEILPLLLDAEADELTGNAATPIARHVRECNRCRTVAGRLQRETDALATAFAHAASRGRVGRRARVPAVVWAAPALATAAMGFVLLTRDGSLADDPPPPARIVAAAPVAQPVSRVSKPAVSAEPRLGLRRVDLAQAVTARPVTVAPFGGADSVVALAVERVQPDAAASPTLIVIAERHGTGDDGTRSDPVIVTPPRGADVRIARTRNPSVTVVWIH